MKDIADEFYTLHKIYQTSMSIRFITVEINSAIQEIHCTLHIAQSLFLDSREVLYAVVL